MRHCCDSDFEKDIMIGQQKQLLTLQLPAQQMTAYLRSVKIYITDFREYSSLTHHSFYYGCPLGTDCPP